MNPSIYVDQHNTLLSFRTAIQFSFHSLVQSIPLQKPGLVSAVVLIAEARFGLQVQDVLTCACKTNCYVTLLIMVFTITMSGLQTHNTGPCVFT